MKIWDQWKVFSFPWLESHTIYLIGLKPLSQFEILISEMNWIKILE
jgi:hypothetical protein